MPPKRSYSKDFRPRGATRHQFTIDRVPVTLFRRIRAKAKREGVSIRAMVLNFLDEWSKPPKP